MILFFFLFGFLSSLPDPSDLSPSIMVDLSDPASAVFVFWPPFYERELWAPILPFLRPGSISTFESVYFAIGSWRIFRENLVSGKYL